MGRVYRALDKRLRRYVAIKVCNRRPSQDADRELALESEARALSRLSHPHIAAIYDLVSEAERDFIVMEFVPGATVKELLATGPLPFPEVVRLGKQMMQGLAAAHRAELVHRDIKPANLKVTATGDLKILDFGLAQLLPSAANQDVTRDMSTHQEPEFSLLGTMPYMSPEQLCGGPADERSDIFSAGAVLYEMATGRQAFPQTMVALLVESILHEEPARPSVVNPDVPCAFDAVVARAMKKRPSQRYRTAGELEAALEVVPVRRSAARVGLGHWLSEFIG